MILDWIYLCPNKNTRRALNISIANLWISYNFLRRTCGGQSGTWSVFAPSTAALNCGFLSTISLCLDLIHPAQQLTASLCNKLQHLLPFISRNIPLILIPNCLPFYVIQMFPWTCYLSGGYRLFKSVNEGNRTPQINVQHSLHFLERDGIPLFTNY